MRWPGNRRNGLVLQLSGVLTFAMGILAIVVPNLLVPAGSGDTTWAWIAGITVLLVGFPLPPLGVVLLIIGTVKAASQEKPR